MAGAPTWTSGGRDPGRECILCGRCLEVCPLFLATGQEELSPRAKFVLTQTLAKPGTKLSEKACADLAGLCLSCGRCASVCPQDLKGADLVAALRAAHPGFATWLWTQWVAKAPLLWPRAAGLARLLPDLPEGLASRLGALATAFSGLKSMADVWTETPWLTVEAFSATGQGRPLALFAGCAALYARPRWKERAEQLLASLGFSLLSLDFTCCGGTLGQAGQPDLKDRARVRNLSLWREAGRPLVATLCASCQHTLGGYAADPQAGQEWKAALVPLTGLLEETAFLSLESAPRDVYYHVPCHDEGGGDFAFLRRALLGRVQTTGQGQCCGFGGVLRLGAPALADRVNARLWSAASPAPGSQVLTGCAACALRLAQTAPAGVAAGHWLDILA